MRQCILKRNNTFQTAWIPNKFARIGKYLEILDQNGWQVISVGIFIKDFNYHRQYFAGGVFIEQKEI
jgi:hypothetical protein